MSVTTYTIQETISELENLPILFPEIYKKNEMTIIIIYSIWGKYKMYLKDLVRFNLGEILLNDLKNFKAYFQHDRDNEGLKDQIIRIESILYDLGLLKKSTFGILFGKREYPIHIVVKHHTLIFT